MKINPEYTKAFVKKGDIYLENEQLEEALRMYTEAHEHNPEGLGGIREKI